jgi:hypothetical protein
VSPHLRALVWLVQMWGAFCAVAGLAVIAFAVAAAFIAFDPAGERPGTEVAAGLTAATLALVGLAAILWSALHILAGQGLRARQPWARVLALALAVCDLVLVPLGTALGLYALWVLLDDSVRGHVLGSHGHVPP